MEGTEIQTGDQRLELRLTSAKGSPRRRSIRQHIAEVAEFLVVVAQFGLVVLLVQYWQLESQLLIRLLWLAFGGFIIHHLLPVRFRLSLGHRLIADKLYEPVVRLLFASPSKEQAPRFQKP